MTEGQVSLFFNENIMIIQILFKISRHIFLDLELNLVDKVLI